MNIHYRMFHVKAIWQNQAVGRFKVLWNLCIGYKSSETEHS